MKYYMAMKINKLKWIETHGHQQQNVKENNISEERIMIPFM